MMKAFETFNNWQQHFKKIFDDDFFSNFQEMMTDSGPRVNVYENGNELVCFIALPGLKNIDDVNVFTNKQSLEVRGRFRLDVPHFKLVQEEIFDGSFSRSIDLPFPVRHDQVHASYQYGILTVHMHRLIPANEGHQRIQIEDLES